MRKTLLASISILVIWVLLVNSGDSVSPSSGKAGAVLLIPGYGGGWGWSDLLVSDLQASGTAILYANVGDMRGDLEVLSRVVSDQVQESGFKGVDIIGFSAGGVLARSVALSIPEYTHKIISIASPHNGSKVASLGMLLGSPNLCPIACQQLSENSEYIKSLDQLKPGKRMLSIYAESDEVVSFRSSILKDGVINYNITEECSIDQISHSEIPSLAVVQNIISSFRLNESISC